MAIATPGSVNRQSGSGGPNVRTSGVRKGGKNQGRVAVTAKLGTALKRG